MLSPEGLTMALYKVQIIQDWPKPQKVKDIQSFLGFANFYPCFIYGYSELTVPLHMPYPKGCYLELHLVIILIHVIVIPIVLITLVLITFALTLALGPLLLANTLSDAFAFLLQALLLHTLFSHITHPCPAQILAHACQLKAIQSGLCWRVQKRLRSMKVKSSKSSKSSKDFKDFTLVRSIFFCTLKCRPYVTAI